MTLSGPTKRLLPTRQRLARHAWSRAGAVAVVLDSHPTRRVLTFSTRLALLLSGSAIISMAVAVTLWTGLGPGPLDVFIGAIRNRTGLPLTVAVWGTVGSLIGVAWLLGRRPGFGTILSPFVIGPMLQGSVAALAAFDAPASLVARLALQVLAVAGIGLGAGALIVSGLGAGSGELLAGAASDRVGRSESSVRMVCEFTWIAVGVALGGPAGLGTVVVAVAVGPAVVAGYHVVDGAAAQSRRGLASVDRRVRELVDA